MKYLTCRRWALLPDEYLARLVGEHKLGIRDLGPQDALTPSITDLLQAFSPARLSDQTAPLSASYVTVPERLIRNLPQKTGYGCKELGIVTTDRRRHVRNEIPPGLQSAPGRRLRPAKMKWMPA